MAERLRGPRPGRLGGRASVGVCARHGCCRCRPGCDGQRTLTPTPTVTPLSIPPVINVFAINPGAVVKQQCATLMWDVSGNVTSIRIFRGGFVILDNGMLAGTAQECPMASGNLAYRIEARNLAGQVTTRELTLIVNP